MKPITPEDITDVLNAAQTAAGDDLDAAECGKWDDVPEDRDTYVNAAQRVIEVTRIMHLHAELLASLAEKLRVQVRCPHSACSQNYIDTGDERCVEGEELG